MTDEGGGWGPLRVESIVSGPVEAIPCVSCGKDTRSHVLFNPGDGWEELTDAEAVYGLRGGSMIRYAVVCHSCFSEMDLPLDSDDWVLYPRSLHRGVVA